MATTDDMPNDIMGAILCDDSDGHDSVLKFGLEPSDTVIPNHHEMVTPPLIIETPTPVAASPLPIPGI